jgi:hypothetical protein
MDTSKVDEWVLPFKNSQHSGEKLVDIPTDWYVHILEGDNDNILKGSEKRLFAITREMFEHILKMRGVEVKRPTIPVDINIEIDTITEVPADANVQQMEEKLYLEICDYTRNKFPDKEWNASVTVNKIKLKEEVVEES